MALRLGDIVECGELFNTKRNSTHGRIQLRGMEGPLMIELTGNCDPDLAGYHFRFAPGPRPRYDEADEPSIDLNQIAMHQVGPTGNITAASPVRIFECSTKEFLIRSKLGEQPPTRWVRNLYIEWYSQNGRVVIELPDPELELLERVDLPGVPMTNEATELVLPPDDSIPKGNLEISTIQLNDEGEAEIRREVYGNPEDQEARCSCKDEYGLVPPEVQSILDRQAAAADRAAKGIETNEDAVLECELMDALIESDCDVPLCSIFDKPMKLPRWETLDEKKAGVVVKLLLTELAMVGIAFHICEHMTALDAYRLLVEKVLWEERAFPQLRGSGWVTNFATSDWCAQCEAEAEREYEEMSRKMKFDEEQGIGARSGLVDSDEESIEDIFPDDPDSEDEDDPSLPF